MLTERARRYFRNFESLINNALNFATTAKFQFLAILLPITARHQCFGFQCFRVYKGERKNKSKLETINSRKGDRQRSLTYTQVQSFE